MLAAGHRAAGLVLISLRLAAGQLAALAAAEVPVVGVDVAARGMPHTVVDDARGGMMAADRPRPSSPPPTPRRSGVLTAADAAGLRVPGDLSVIGFDDIEAAAQWSLSTVRQPLRESGTRGAVRLCQLLRGEAVRPLREVLPLELIVRGSTTAACGRRTADRAARRSPSRPDPGPGCPSRGPCKWNDKEKGKHHDRRCRPPGADDADCCSSRWWQRLRLPSPHAVAAAAARRSGGSSSTPAGSATSGSITWWASPITTSSPDPRTVLIQKFEQAYPKIHVTLQSAPTDTDTNRASLVTTISGGSASPDVFMGDVIWPAEFGAHQLAEPLSKYLPASYWSTFAPGLVAGRHLQGPDLRRAVLRGPGVPLLPEGPAQEGGPGGTQDLAAAGERRRHAQEQGPGQVRLRLAGRLV